MIALAGKAIVLREFQITDADRAAEIVGDDRVTYWLSFDSRDRNAAESMINGAIRRSKEQPRAEYYLGIADLDTDDLLGFIRLALGGVRAAKLGYAIRADRWGRGIASEAVGLVVQYAFGPLGLHRITAAIGPDNVRSVSLVEKFGFKYEGRLRDHVYTNSAWRDSLLYALLNDRDLV